MNLEEKSNKKGCLGCLPLIFILIFGINLFPSIFKFKKDVAQESIETDLLSFKDGTYKIKSQDLKEPIINSNYQWSFRTSKFKNKNLNVSIDVIENEVVKALILLNSIYYMTDEELHLTIDYDIDPDGAATEFWGEIYRTIIKKTGSQVETIADGLKEIAINEKLNNNDLLWMTITMVQNITYKIPEEKYGIIPPIVSIAREYGDCDTTTILLHSILKQLGFDSVLFYSRVYAHAMLGINTNATGEYKTLNALNYYFLEVTNPGWSIGQVSTEFNDLDKWFLIEL